MKKIVKINEVYLKYLKNDKIITYKIELENQITFNQFFNLNFNLHHLIMKFYKSYFKEDLLIKNFKKVFKDNGWIILDRIGSNENCGKIKTSYRVINETLRKCKYELNKNIQIKESKINKMGMLDIQKEFIEELLMLEPIYFTRTSLKQVNRTINQERKLCEISINANPNNLESINCCFNLIIHYLEKLSKNFEWFGFRQLKNYQTNINTITSTPAQENTYLDLSKENLEIQIGSEAQIELTEQAFKELELCLEGIL